MTGRIWWIPAARSHAPSLRCGTGRGATRRGKSLQWSDLSDETPGPPCHTPKTPVDRRGVSLTFNCGLPLGAKASPVHRFILSDHREDAFFETSEAGWLSDNSACPEVRAYPHPAALSALCAQAALPSPQEGGRRKNRGGAAIASLPLVGRDRGWGCPRSGRSFESPPGTHRHPGHRPGDQCGPLGEPPHSPRGRAPGPCWRAQM
jgi:hypothetical protein